MGDDGGWQDCEILGQDTCFEEPMYRVKFNDDRKNQHVLPELQLDILLHHRAEVAGAASSLKVKILLIVVQQNPCYALLSNNRSMQ